MTPSRSVDSAEAPSGASSKASPSDVGLLGDAGPDFDPGAAPPPAATPPDEPHPSARVDLWSEDRVRTVLETQGAVVHGLVAVEPESTEWLYTRADLQAIAPPLTRILNRYDATRAAAAASDELAVAVGFAGYAARSYSERKSALAALAADYEPPTGDPVASPGDLAAAAAFTDPADWPDESEPPPIPAAARR
jgi:hypothetical protein